MLFRSGPQLPNDLPRRLLEKYALPSALEAAREIHFPKSEAEIDELLGFKTRWHARFIYEEFFKFEYFVLMQKLGVAKERAPSIGLEGGAKSARDLEGLLPFRLTGGQSQALADILEDMKAPHPMNRLVQGDVGSGKTVVALLSAAAALAEGFQAALMAPTEILAEQHYRNAVKLFGGRLRVELLTGKTPDSERNRLLDRKSTRLNSSHVSESRMPSSA